MALGGRPRRVQGQQLVGEVRDRLADPLLGAQPLGAPELAELWPLPAGVARDPRDLLDRHEDPVAAGERQLEVVALLPFPAAAQHLLVARDAVIDVDDEVARREPLQDVAWDDPPERLRPADADGPEQLAVRDERETVRPTHEPAVEAAPDQRDRPGRWRLLDPLDDGDRVARLLEDLGQARRLVRGEHDAAAVLPPAR